MVMGSVECLAVLKANVVCEQNKRKGYRKYDIYVSLKGLFHFYYPYCGAHKTKLLKIN